MKAFLIPTLALVVLALAGCGSSDADSVTPPAAATQGGPSNKNPRMKAALGMSPDGGQSKAMSSASSGNQ